MLAFFLWTACGGNDPGELGDSGSELGEKQTDTAQPEPSAEEVEPDPCADPEGSEAVHPSDLEGREDCGEALYLARCAICHLEDGSGSDAGRPLVNQLDDYSDDYLYVAIETGQGTMPPQNLSPQELADVVVYLRSAM